MRTAAIILLLLHVILLVWSARRLSPTSNEPAHLAAGLCHLTFGRFEPYRVNPPLTRMVAALPLLVVSPETDWKSFHDGPGARPVFSMGLDFVAANGEQTVWLVTLARWSCIPFSIIGAYFAYRWSRMLSGPAAGLLTLTLWCFSPCMLAHGALITPDRAAAAMGLVCAFFFWRYLREPTWAWAIVSGVTLGLAELTRSTWCLLFGLWPLIWAIQCVMRIGSVHLRSSRALLQMTVIVGLGIYVLNMGYGFEGTWTQLGKFEFVSRTLGGSELSAGGSANRFRGTVLESIPVPLPGNYVVGIDVQKRDFEKFGHPSYLRGTWREQGWWYYYIYAALVKLPAGTWCLIAAGLCWCRRRGTAFVEILPLVAPPVAILLLVSSQTGINHHFRYVVPALPFLFVLLGHLASVAAGCPRRTRFVLMAVVWMVISSVMTFPHSLSYFNEPAGGPLNGHAHLANSNIDWSQDLLILKEWIDDHGPAGPVYSAIDCPYDPRAIGVDCRPFADAVDAAVSAQTGATWFAVSVNYVRGYGFRAPAGADQRFLQVTPTDCAGYSIYLYRCPGGLPPAALR